MDHIVQYKNCKGEWTALGGLLAFDPAYDIYTNATHSGEYKAVRLVEIDWEAPNMGISASWSKS